MERQVLDTLHISNSELMVAVEMITYNHQDYISQAIESVLMQKTNFSYKIIICEDGSTDNTAKICQSYKDRFPDKIELYLNKKNLGLSINAKQLHDASFNSGARYIAILDGDDYWTDDLKLQKQFDFLESHPDYSLCYHKIKWVHTYQTDLDPNRESNENDPETSDIKDLIRKGWFIRTCSMFYRNFKLPAGFDKLHVGDYPIQVLSAYTGKIKFINEAMGVYRINDKGFSEQHLHVHTFEKRKQNFLSEIFLHNYLDEHTKFKYRREFRKKKNLTTYNYLFFVWKNYKKRLFSELHYALKPKFISYFGKKTLGFVANKITPKKQY